MTLQAVHAAAALARRFERLLKRAERNYAELIRLKALEGFRVREEPPPGLEEEERADYYKAVDEYRKLVEGFEKLAGSKEFEEFRGWSWGESFVKWAGKECAVSVGYSGTKRERSAENFLLDIPVCSPTGKMEDLFRLYGLDRLEGLRPPSQEEAESELLDFLEYRKRWPRRQLLWALRNLHPLEEGFWASASRILGVESLEKAWEDALRRAEARASGELMRAPQFKTLEQLLGSWDAERKVRELAGEAKEEVARKYAREPEDVEKVEGELLARARELFSERLPPEPRVAEVFEELKEVVSPERAERLRGVLLEAIRRAFLDPQVRVDTFASLHIWPLGFDLEEAKRIAAKILEKVTKKPVPVEVPPKVELVEVRFLEDADQLVGPDLKPYGPFRKGSVASVPKESAEELVKKGVAVYEAAYREERERELSAVRSELERRGKFDRLAYFLNNRKKWRFITPEEQREMLRKAVEGWKPRDYQTFYDAYFWKVEHVVPAFEELGLPPPPPPEVPESVPALREELEEERARRRGAELSAEEEKRRAEVLRPAVEVAPPPVREPVPEEEYVVKRECYKTFSKLWDEIKRAGAMEVSIPVVSGRTGIGEDLIREALSYSRMKSWEKIEKLANALIECQCEIELKGKGAGFLGEVKGCGEKGKEKES